MPAKTPKGPINASGELYRASVSPLILEVDLEVFFYGKLIKLEDFEKLKFLQNFIKSTPH